MTTLLAQEMYRRIMHQF